MDMFGPSPLETAALSAGPITTGTAPIDGDLIRSEDELARVLEREIQQRSQLSGTATAVSNELGLEDLAYIKEDRISKDDLSAGIQHGAPVSVPWRKRLLSAAKKTMYTVMGLPGLATRLLEALNLPLEFFGATQTLRNAIGFVGLHTLAAAVCLMAYATFGSQIAVSMAGILVIPLAMIFYLLFLSVGASGKTVE